MITLATIRRLCRHAGLTVRMDGAKTVVEDVPVRVHRPRVVREVYRVPLTDPTALHVVLTPDGRWAWHLPRRAGHVTVRPTIGHAPPARPALRLFYWRMQRHALRRMVQRPRQVFVAPEVNEMRRGPVRVHGEG